MELVSGFLDNFIILLNAMSIYIIIGLFIAGILKQVIPDNFVSSHLGKNSTSSVIKATLFGIPLPVCCCSVIPLAQGLKKEGASKGAIQSFLISTPITGVDSILATYSLFGFVFVVFRIVSSIIIAITVGLVQNFVQKKDNTKLDSLETSLGTSSSCCSSSSCEANINVKESFSFIKVLTYGYIVLFNSMAKALLVGLVLGSLFVTFMPKEYTQVLFENQFLTYIVIILFSMPLYTCATASLPLAAAFMLQGMSPGAVFIFLTAGPATSAITMSVVYKMLGKTSLIIYSSIIAVLSLLFGFIYDTFFKELTLLTIITDHEHINIFNIIASVLMMVLIFYHLIKDTFSKKESCCSSKNENSNRPKNNFILNKNIDLTSKPKFSNDIKKDIMFRVKE